MASAPTLVGRVEYRLDLLPGGRLGGGGGGGDESHSKGGVKQSSTSTSTSTSSAGRKRPRPPSSDGGDCSSSIGGGGGEEKRSLPNTSDTSSRWVHTAGYYFLPTRAANDSGRHGDGDGDGGGCGSYPLVVPHGLIGVVCDAARRSRSGVSSVEVARYALVRHVSGRSDSGGSANLSDGVGVDVGDSNNDGSVLVMEVHDGGMRLLDDVPPTKKLNSDRDGKEDDPPLTLSQFVKVEESLRTEKKKGRNKASGGSRGDKAKERYSVRAIVDASSPIIAAVPSDPFALVELYEEVGVPTGDTSSDGEPLSTQRHQQPPPSLEPLGAVAVLRGLSALSVHSALQPGVEVTLTGVRRQRWHVPKSFSGEGGDGLPSRLKDRAPTHVLVVDDARSVSWSTAPRAGNEGCRIDAEEEEEGEEDGNDSDESEGGGPTLPTTVTPLEAIQGLIVSIRRTNAGPGGTETVHTVTIIEEGGDGGGGVTRRRMKLYLTYYPMSPDLIWGLRVGASVRAVNVHRIDNVGPTGTGPFGIEEGCPPSSWAYGTCLRSSVCVLRCTSDAGRRHGTSFPNGTSRSNNGEETRILTRQSPPYSFVNVRRPYREYEWRSRLRTSWYEKSGLGSMVPTSPEFDVIANSLLEYYREKSRSRAEETKTSSPPSLSAYATTNGGSARQKKRTKRRRRDPYAEFFDHACDDDDDENRVENVGHEKDRCLDGCGVCQASSESPNGWPTVLPLQFVRDRCVRHVKRRIACYLDCGGKNVMNPNVSGGEMDRRRQREVESGWTSSVSLSDHVLCQILFEEEDVDILLQSSCPRRQQHIDLFACGFVNRDWTSIRDGECQLPVVRSSSALMDGDKDRSSRNMRGTPCFRGEGFAAVGVHSVMVSCLCLGAKPKDSSPKRENLSNQQQPTSRAATEGDDGDNPACSITKTLPQLAGPLGSTDTGACAVFIMKGLIFILSVYIRPLGDNQLQIKAVSRLESISEDDTQELEERSNRQLVSVQDCLAGDPMAGERSFVLGRLVRRRFSFRKLRHDTHKGCILTLSHIPLIPHASKRECEVSTNQSLELKLSVPHLSAKVTSQMRVALQFLLVERLDSGSNKVVFSHIVSDDQINLASAWWRMAENGRFCSLLCGGCDEYCGSTESSIHWSVRLAFPFSARETSKHGYQRFSCELDDIEVHSVSSRAATLNASIDSDSGLDFGENATSDPSSVPATAYPLFDYVGGEKFLPGMLDRRARRKQSSVGESWSCPPEGTSGVPASSLAQLHWGICRDLKEKTKTTVAPSLVGRVSGAQLLGITFCRARAECTRCFTFLSLRREKERKDPTSGVVNSVKLSTLSDDKNADTFWHLPLPFGCSGDRFTKLKADSSLCGTEKKKSQDGTTSKNNFDGGQGRYSTKLRCPSDCPIDLAAIKWECSGIIDDGTGQAKLHAEREAALALLGDRFDVMSVEEGAWATEAGITFQKSVPPRSFIKNAVREAQMMAHQLAKDRVTNKRRKVNQFDVLKLLTQEARAEYILQRHCRQSKHPMRRMVFLCRCKPISDGASCLNRTEVDVASARREQSEAVTSDVATYSLPPLKLNLVDCFSVSRNWCDRDEGWDLLRACRYDLF